eukprot:TRINITY_DN19382_c0_g1_i1.p1 TRINITY_DN19382_c0_g1~~TRINITY_DN19382_c0_g1_i1.p1  ORF type:complete len:450 (-),score=63.31 TRINITY_DN19382_c0_g1_i1:306-1655(-)
MYHRCTLRLLSLTLLFNCLSGSWAFQRSLKHGSSEATPNVFTEDIAHGAGLANSSAADGLHSLQKEFSKVWSSLGNQTQEWYDDIFGEPKARTVSAVGNTQLSDWIRLALIVIGLMLLDSCFLQPWFAGRCEFHDHLGMLCFWVLVGLGFNAFVYVTAGEIEATNWMTGYLLEWLLSMDNLFVFHLIFKTYSVPSVALHKALFVGILGACVLRIFAFAALTELLSLTKWIRFGMGLFLIVSGVGALREDDDDDDVSECAAVHWLRKLMGPRLLDRYEGSSVFVQEHGQICATLLLPVILCLEVTDIIFAVDSISAKAAQIPNYYISYSSSVIAMFGLRAAFFVLEDAVQAFDLLKYGLCVILCFIGLELVTSDFVKLPASQVCIVISCVFFVSIAASLWKAKAAARDQSIALAKVIKALEAASVNLNKSKDCPFKISEQTAETRMEALP